MLDIIGIWPSMTPHLSYLGRDTSPPTCEEYNSHYAYTKLACALIVELGYYSYSVECE